MSDAGSPEMRSAIDRRLASVRYIGSRTARYILASRQNRVDNEVRVFACRVKSITPHRVVLAAPVSGIKGEWATVQAGRFRPAQAQDREGD